MKRLVALLGILLPLATSCGHDAADRLYLEALDGEERGMTREEQIAHIDRAIQLKPRRAFYYETRAGYWIDLRQYDRAVRDLDRAIELTPRPYAFYMRALASCEGGNVARSLEDFDMAIARDSTNWQFYRGRSLARAATGDREGALRDAERLIAHLPQRGESWYARGVALSLQGRDREAVEDFDRAAAIRPELVYVVEARARALERLGEAVRAQSDLEASSRLRDEHGGCAACLDPYRY